MIRLHSHTQDLTALQTISERIRKLASQTHDAKRITDTQKIVDADVQAMLAKRKAQHEGESNGTT